MLCKRSQRTSYTGEPRFALGVPLRVFSIPISVFRIILWHNPIKMCAHGAHTFIFHAPEGRASYAGGVLHAPPARFICGALRRSAPPYPLV